MAGGVELDAPLMTRHAAHGNRLAARCRRCRDRPAKGISKLRLRAVEWLGPRMLAEFRRWSSPKRIDGNGMIAKRVSRSHDAKQEPSDAEGARGNHHRIVIELPTSLGRACDRDQRAFSAAAARAIAFSSSAGLRFGKRKSVEP
jgi:hypothetical protein